VEYGTVVPNGAWVESMTDRTTDTLDQSGDNETSDSQADAEGVSSNPISDVVTEAKETVDHNPIEASVSTIAETVEEVIDDAEDELPDDIGSPAFEFDETTQRSMYVREASLQELDDLEALVDARLRTEYDVRNLTGSEFYDAVLRVAATHEEEVVSAILSARAESE